MTDTFPPLTLCQIIVDSTVLEKAIAHPTDSKLLEIAPIKLVEAAKAEGIEVKQTYAKEGQVLCYKAGRYALVRQFKRMRKVDQTPKHHRGAPAPRDFTKDDHLEPGHSSCFGLSIDKAKLLIAQSRSK